MNRFCSLFCLFLFCLFSVPRGGAAANLDTQNYRRAFSLLDAGRVEEAAHFAEHGHDPSLNKVLMGYYMAQPGNDVPFGELLTFITQNPDWPNLKGIIAIAEQKIPGNATPQQIVNWFNAHPPQTIMGFYRYADALGANNMGDKLREVIRNRWVDGDFSIEEQAAFLARFGNYLTEAEYADRLNKLLWRDQFTEARRMFPLVSETTRAVAEARLALMGHTGSASSILSRVPSDARDDAGLIFEQLRWAVRNNQDADAEDILLSPPADLGKPEAWWEQRQIIIRRAIERHDFARAFRLAVLHGQTEPKQVAQAEFLAGWLALRFLNEPQAALEHFQALYDASSTPISRARGAYWLGRTYEALGNRSEAEQAYENAAAMNITFYGQLAATRLQANPVIRATPEPTIPVAARNAYLMQDNIRAIEKLNDMGERDRARLFFHAAMEAAHRRADFALLTEIAYRLERPDLAIEAAKNANQKNMLMTAGGFPVLENKLPEPPEPAFTHALIRQESMFNADAASGAGAKGLMQLMPSTAKSVARKMDIRYRPNQLGDPNYNLRLGTRFVQDQIESFDGSYVLALAGYNAGPHRVREWMSQIGDPRSGNVDPVDWIELIPIAETRNYVQRIIENLQVYRARLNGGQAPLLILKDLKR
ncbi:MAG: lytic transglycosylase domain-containing protein [Alphaproteobacteria bacterium]|nr:lytic transglycosylase domain-containing protein [Alphaproteobacteria bacterium]MBV8548882.1 lytic transglycosylase domain-containing protein [Alphaproteobacteria bacterium]